MFIFSGYAPQQQQHKNKGILGGLGGLFGGKSGGGGGGGGILSGNKGKAAAGLLLNHLLHVFTGISIF